MDRRVLLLGANGQVGRELRRAFTHWNVLALDREKADLSNPEGLRAVVREANPSVILNAAAYTAVDRAESEAEMADIVNHRAAMVLAQEAERLGSLLIHYSTDYVFDGSKSEPWIESDTPAPLNVYGMSKLAGEYAIARSCQRYVILRTSWVYGAQGSNFLRTMLRLGVERPVVKVVMDQWGAPTSAFALADVTRSIAEQLDVAAQRKRGENPSSANWAGIYHATCAGKTTWLDFAETIFQTASAHGLKSRPLVEGIPSSSYPTPARRPQNSVLANQKLFEEFGVQLPHWRRALETVFDDLVQTGWPLKST